MLSAEQGPDEVSYHIARRFALHHEIGELSHRLAEVTMEYNQCIGKTIEVNDWLRAHGIGALEFPPSPMPEEAPTASIRLIQ